jgi:hypothetical protein
METTSKAERIIKQLMGDLSEKLLELYNNNFCLKAYSGGNLID